MKNTKKIIIPLLAVAGVMAARISVSADTTFCNNDTVSHLKKCLLLNEYNRYVQENNYNYWNYDINKNNKVDVFDVCRMKAAMLDQSNQTTTTPESTTTVTTTTTPEPTTTVTTTTTPEPTTTVTTTTTPEPTTTVTTTTTSEPTTTVTTTTTPEPTTTVTTTTTPELTTTVTTTTTPGASAQIQEIEIDAVNKINQARTSAGYRTLKMDTTLCYCADIRVKELQQSYSVNRPDGSQYNTLLMNNDAPGWYQSYQYANKNFTSADSFVAQLVRFFAKNPGQGINDPAFNNIGVGYDNGYWVVFFTV